MNCTSGAAARIASPLQHIYLGAVIFNCKYRDNGLVLRKLVLFQQFVLVSQMRIRRLVGYFVHPVWDASNHRNESYPANLLRLLGRHSHTNFGARFLWKDDRSHT